MTINATATREALGAALLDSKAVDAVLTLDVQDLELEIDKSILGAVKSLQSSSDPVNLVSVDAATGSQYTDYLMDIVAGVASTTMAIAHVKTIKEQAKRRRLRAAATQLYNDSSDVSKSLDEITAEFGRNIDDIAQVEGGTVSSSDALLALLGEFDKKDEQKAYTGVPLLDQALGGMQGGRLYVVGARPATGKTALAISAAFNSCINGTVLFCSYEMQPSEIMGRMLARLSRVNSQDISYRTLTDAQYQRLGEYYGMAGNLPIRYGINCYTPEKIRAEALRLNKGGQLRLICVDYLQLMSSGKRAESRRVEVGQISRALKQLSIELNVPILALSQLNRVSEGTASKAPTMSEMRESGDIEQDADVIVLMYQLPDEDNTFVQTCEDNEYKAVRILLDKNRQGKSGVAIDTAFDGATMTFISKSAVMEVGQ